MCDLKEYETNTGNRSKFRFGKESEVHAHCTDVFLTATVIVFQSTFPVLQFSYLQ